MPPPRSYTTLSVSRCKEGTTKANHRPHGIPLVSPSCPVRAIRGAPPARQSPYSQAGPGHIDTVPLDIMVTIWITRQCLRLLQEIPSSALAPTVIHMGRGRTSHFFAAPLLQDEHCLSQRKIDPRVLPACTKGSACASQPPNVLLHVDEQSACIHNYFMAPYDESYRR